MVQSCTCVQKVARSHVHLVLSFGSKCHRETRKTGRYQDYFVWSFADSHRPHRVASAGDQSISINETSVWRLPATLTHHRDRVREISFGGSGSECYPIFTKFIEAASYHFPALESLVFCFEHVRKLLEFPATFLRGPDQSDLPFRRLGWYGSYSTFSISGFLPSATALTDLTLNFATSNLGQFDPSERSSFFARLQGMQRLRKLDLTMPSVGFCPRPSIRRFPKILPPVF